MRGVCPSVHKVDGTSCPGPAWWRVIASWFCPGGMFCPGHAWVRWGGEGKERAGVPWPSDPTPPPARFGLGGAATRLGGPTSSLPLGRSCGWAAHPYSLYLDRSSPGIWSSMVRIEYRGWYCFAVGVCLVSKKNPIT